MSLGRDLTTHRPRRSARLAANSTAALQVRLQPVQTHPMVHNRPLSSLFLQLKRLIARLNYVNSFPVTSVRFGCETLAPTFFDGAEPDLVVSGPNVGNNLGSTVLISGTVYVLPCTAMKFGLISSIIDSGAACEAAKEGIPAIAFSGDGGAQVSYTTLNESSASTTTAEVFAALGV